MGVDGFPAAGRRFSSDSLVEFRQFDEFEDCCFDGCVLSDFDLGGRKFIDCEFVNSDLSMVRVTDILFRDVNFDSCKMLGVDFGECLHSLLSMKFTGCVLNYSSFNGLELPGTIFDHCSLEEVSFVDSDLKGAEFTESDLRGAVFRHSCLLDADFSTAYGYEIDPEENMISGAKFSSLGLIGLLGKYAIEVV